MSDSPDNMVLTLLREMREENRAFRAEMSRFREETNDRLDDVEKQMMGVSSILMLIHGNSLTLEERIAALEHLNAAPAE